MERVKKADANFNLGKQAKMPVRFRCKVGGEWKPLDGFSKNQQAKWAKPGVDAAHSGMTCLEHGTRLHNEFRCEGKCGLVKPREQFSKSQLKSGTYVCQRCVAWDETQEWEVTPGPQETGHISAEEAGAMNPLSAEEWVLFGNDMTPLAPITNSASYSLESSSQSNQSASETSSISESDTGTGILPPHLASALGSNSTGPAWGASAASSSNSASGNRGQDWVPPHKRGPGSWSTATTTREDKRAMEESRKVHYNAWDTRGVQHNAVKNPTVPSSGETDSSAGEDGWNVVENKRNVAQTETTRKKRSNWPDHRENRLTRTELLNWDGAEAQFTLPRFDPEMERQRRTKQSEDDNWN